MSQRYGSGRDRAPVADGPEDPLKSLRVHESDNLRLKAVLQDPTQYSLDEIRKRLEAVRPLGSLPGALQQREVHFNSPLSADGIGGIQGAYELLVSYCLGFENCDQPIIAASELSLQAFILPPHTILDGAVARGLVDSLRTQPEMLEQIERCRLRGSTPPDYWFDPHVRIPAGEELTVAHDSLSERSLRVGKLSTVYRSFMYGEGFLVCKYQNALASTHRETLPAGMPDSSIGYQIWDHRDATPWRPFEEQDVVHWTTIGRNGAAEHGESVLGFRGSEQGLTISNLGSFEVEVALRETNSNSAK